MRRNLITLIYGYSNDYDHHHNHMTRHMTIPARVYSYIMHLQQYLAVHIPHTRGVRDSDCVLGVRVKGMWLGWYFRAFAPGWI